MVSHADLPAHIVTMLQQHCPFVFTHQYTIDPSPHRFLDLLEIFAGAGRLSKSADAVSGLEWFAVVSLLLLIMMFSPTPYLRRLVLSLATTKFVVMSEKMPQLPRDSCCVLWLQSMNFLARLLF